MNRLSQIQTESFSAQRFAALVIALVMGLNVVSNLLATISSRPFEVLLGIETRQDYLARNLGAYHAMTVWANANLPHGARIVSLWEPRAYYVEPAMEPDAILDRFAHLQVLTEGDANVIADRWRQEGITHVLLFREGLNGMLQSGYDPISVSEMETLQTLEQEHLQIVYGDAPLGLTSRDGRPALAEPETEPYAVYVLK